MTTTATTLPSGRRRLSRIIRKYQLPEYTGLKKSALDALINSDDFPKPFRPSQGGRALCWFEDEIAEWQERRRTSHTASEAA